MWRWKDKRFEKFDSRQIAKNWATYIILGMALFAMVIFGICTPSGDRGPNMLSGDAGKVDGERITSREFKMAYRNAYSQYQKQYKENFDPAALRLANMVLNSLVDQRIYYVESERSGLFTTEREVDDYLLKLDFLKDEKGNFSTERLDRFMAYNGFTEKTLTEQLKRELTYSKFRDYIVSNFYLSRNSLKYSTLLKETKMNVEYIDFSKNKIAFKLTDARIAEFVKEEANKKKIEEYYNANTSKFNTKKKVKARHILVAHKDARSAPSGAKKRSKVEAKKRALDILKEVSKNRGKFKELASKYTDDPSGKSSGGDLGFFDRDAMVKEFSEVAFKLKAGEMSELVDSPFGFHIILVEKVKEAKSTPLAQATNQIAKELIRKDEKPKLVVKVAEEILEKLKSGANIDALLKDNGLSWMATGDFALDARYIPGFGSKKEFREAFFGLSMANKLLGKVLTVDKKSYIVRLKSRTEADQAKLAADKLEEQAKTSKFMETYTLLSVVGSAIKDSYEKDKKIWRNQEYINIDLNRRQQ